MSLRREDGTPSCFRYASASVGACPSLDARSDGRSSVGSAEAVVGRAPRGRPGRWPPPAQPASRRRRALWRGARSCRHPARRTTSTAAGSMPAPICARRPWVPRRPHRRRSRHRPYEPALAVRVPISGLKRRPAEPGATPPRSSQDRGQTSHAGPAGWCG